MPQKTKPVKRPKSDLTPEDRAIVQAVRLRRAGRRVRFAGKLLGAPSLMGHCVFTRVHAIDDGPDDAARACASLIERAIARAPRAQPVHRRYMDTAGRDDLRSLAKCNNINGPICPEEQLTSDADKVTCGRCKRIARGCR